MYKSDKYYSELPGFEDLNKKIFDTAFDSFYPALCYFAYKIVHEKETAEDIVSDAFLILYRNKRNLKKPSSVRSYLYQVVKNECLECLRKRRLNDKVRINFNEKSIEDKTVLYAMIESEMLAELNEAINSLPVQCKRIFKMFYFEEKSYKEIAEELKLSINTIRNQKARAISLLRDRLVIFLVLLSSNIF